MYVDRNNIHSVFAGEVRAGSNEVYCYDLIEGINLPLQIFFTIEHLSCQINPLV